jgi:hypothetical protein
MLLRLLGGRYREGVLEAARAADSIEILTRVVRDRVDITEYLTSYAAPIDSTLFPDDDAAVSGFFRQDEVVASAVAGYHVGYESIEALDALGISQTLPVQELAEDPDYVAASLVNRFLTGDQFSHLMWVDSVKDGVLEFNPAVAPLSNFVESTAARLATQLAEIGYTAFEAMYENNNPDTQATLATAEQTLAALVSEFEEHFPFGENSIVAAYETRKADYIQAQSVPTLLDVAALEDAAYSAFESVVARPSSDQLRMILQTAETAFYDVTTLVQDEDPNVLTQRYQERVAARLQQGAEALSTELQHLAVDVGAGLDHYIRTGMAEDILLRDATGHYDDLVAEFAQMHAGVPAYVSTRIDAVKECMSDVIVAYVSHGKGTDQVKTAEGHLEAVLDGVYQTIGTLEAQYELSLTPLCERLRTLEDTHRTSVFGAQSARMGGMVAQDESDDPEITIGNPLREVTREHQYEAPPGK